MACHSCKNFTEFSDTIEVDLLTTQHIVATQILHVLDQRSGALRIAYKCTEVKAVFFGCFLSPCVHPGHAGFHSLLQCIHSCQLCMQWVDLGCV